MTLHHRRVVYHKPEKNNPLTLSRGSPLWDSNQSLRRFACQWDEQDGAHAAGGDLAIDALLHEQERLFPVQFTHGDRHATAGLELLDQRRRDMVRARGYNNRIEG